MLWWKTLYHNFVIIDGDFANFREIEDIFNCCMAAFCVSCAGLAAGLTMGLLSLDATKLEIKSRVGTVEEKRDAETVLPVVKQHHLLLVTLLLFNSIANETLPVFLGELVPNYLAILLSVFLILIFGEILPSAFFTGAQQLHTSARLIPVVYTLMFILYPIAYPISRILDKLFGEDEEEGPLRRSEFEALVHMQQSHAVATAVKLNTDRHLVSANNNNITNGPVLVRENSILPPLNPDRVSRGWESDYGSTDEGIALLSLEEGKGLKEGLAKEVDRTAENTSSSIDKENSISNHRNHERNETDGLSTSEVTLLLGVLNLSKLTVGCAMIDMQKMYMVSSLNRLDDRNFLQNVMETGFSRIPVFKQQNPYHILGYMLVKELILSEKDVTIEDIKLREPLFVKPEVGLLEMLGIFQEGQCHLAIVTADPTCTVQHLRAGHTPPHYARVLGLVTLEDVLEKVIQGDIVDETDTTGNFNLESPSRGVGATTTTLARNLNRAHTVSDFFTDPTTISGTNDTRRRSRGRSNSRVNLTALSSINVVAGDVRHKDRDTSPTRSWSVSTANSTITFGSPSGSTTAALGGVTPPAACNKKQQRTPNQHVDFFNDVVDTHIQLKD